MKESTFDLPESSLHIKRFALNIRGHVFIYAGLFFHINIQLDLVDSLLNNFSSSGITSPSQPYVEIRVRTQCHCENRHAS